MNFFTITYSNLMKTKNVFSLLTAVLTFATAFVLTGCSDDDSDVHRGVLNFQNLKDTSYHEGSSVTVSSGSKPQKGQKHRSSDNFSTASLSGEDPQYMIVSCPDGVGFELNIDRSGSDEVYDDDVYNGCILPYRNSSKFYISNPRGATSDFEVTFTALTRYGIGEFVSSPGRKLKGESHRASRNMLLLDTSTRYKVHCTDPSVTFGLYLDIPLLSDDKIALKLKDGDIINIPPGGYEDCYITDPVGASGAFQVCFEEYTVEWMTALDDNTLISDISIPGTHDTGTYALEELNFGFSKCQNMSIMDQLDFGIRYFDLRVTSGLDIEHGGIPCNVSFDEIVWDTREFFRKHPGETVIFELTGDSDFVTKFNDYLETSDCSRYFWLGNYVPRLGEVRGRIMIVRRYTYDDVQGLDFASNGVWPKDGSKHGKNADGIDYYIEDKYFDAGSTTNHDTHKKRDVLYEAFDYKLAHPGTLCISFSSISASIHTPYQFMWGGGSPGVDPRMCDVLSSKLTELQSGVNPVGIVVMDYYNRNCKDDFAHVVELLINTNFPDDRKIFKMSGLHSTED